MGRYGVGGETGGRGPTHSARGRVVLSAAWGEGTGESRQWSQWTLVAG
jgi:hypothetical protein